MVAHGGGDQAFKTTGDCAVTPDLFVEQSGRVKAGAILCTNDQEKAAKAKQAAVRGGFNIIEFTLTIHV